ncbi:MAG: hypothetical protein LBC20_12310 [Planctomycetaceae bacterium]|jgi:hypothetical protein|nr:hypothetical protein [Planctomycetaceae bacterium]
MFTSDHKFKNTDLVYSITVNDLQNEAASCLGRTLTTNEIIVIQDLLSDGIGETISFIYDAIFSELPNRL